MTALMIYSLGVSISLSLIYAVAHLSTRRLTWIGFRRALLICVALVSLLLPVLLFTGGNGGSQSGTAGAIQVWIGTPVVSAVAEGAESGVRFVDVIRWMSMIYVAGLVVALAYFVAATLRIISFIRRGTPVAGTSGRVVVCDSCDFAPFSWGGKIVVGPTDFGDAFEMVMRHEECHMRRGHWLDLLLMSAVCAIAWYCPASWMMRRELRDLHEYEADLSVVESGVSAEEYQMLLIRKTAGLRFQSVADSLNHSSLKKRITMMLSKKSAGKARLRALAVLPAAAIVAAVMCSTTVSAEVSEIMAGMRNAGKVTNSPEIIMTSEPAAAPVVAAAEEEKVYESVQVEPEFPGGQMALMDWLSRNLQYPQDAIAAQKQGTSMVRFVVTSKGKVTNPKLVRSSGYKSLDEEALRVVGELPDFKPGMKDGKAVAVWYTLPMRFRLTTDGKK